MPYEQYPSIPAHRLFHHKGTSFPLSPPRKAWIRTGENAFNLEKLWLPLPGSAFARYCLARVCCLHQKRHCDSLSWASFQFSDKLSCRLQDDPLWEWAGRWIGYKAGNFHARSTGLPLFSSCLRSACSQPDTSPQTSKCRASDLDLDLVLASRSRSSLAPSDTSTPITIRKETQKRERQRLQRSCTGMKKDSRLHSRWDLMATCEPWLGDRNRSHC